jgi:hypothetical protein
MLKCRKDSPAPRNTHYRNHLFLDGLLGVRRAPAGIKHNLKRISSQAQTINLFPTHQDRFINLSFCIFAIPGGKIA